MKKQLSFITNQHGFFLPYVLFITGLVFIIITASISIYKQDITLTHRLVEQTKLKSLEQMGRVSFKENFEEMTSPADTVNYSFPDGTVKITYDVLNDQEIELYFKIRTKENAGYTYNQTQTLHLDEDDTNKDNNEKRRER
ncbi:MAG TPA: hypothetical protein VK091_07915 [Virgibacillus sp.]|nr:hypothetical protein [Virgibacillus sp.]